MKRFAFIPVVAVIALGGCTHQIWIMDENDHKMLTETHDMAQQAKDASTQASADAKAAKDAADKALAAAQQSDNDAQKAEADAQAASTKADRMFVQSQNK